MRLDETHRPWAVATLTILAVAGIGYAAYAAFYPGGPRGNTLPGLMYGLLGYLMMLFAGLLGARKKVPLWRIGRAKIWMRGHLWLGFLSLPMILFHSAFSARGPLTFVLITLLVVVVLSGLTGALFQHLIPRRMAAAAPSETIYEQIPEVREQLRQEASEIIEKLCGVREEAPVAVAGAAAVPAVAGAVTEDEDAPELTEQEQHNLRHVYNEAILPFLRQPESGKSPLAHSTKANEFFDALRRQMPVSIHESIRDLESICSEERQLNRQSRMYLLLHAWTLVHVPLSITLLVLGAIHAVVAIRY